MPAKPFASFHSWPANARTAATLALGLAGGAALAATGMPGAWIAGAMVAVAVASLSGLPMLVPDRVAQIAFVLVGITIGSGVTPETVERLPSWPVTMTLVMLSVPVISGAIYLFLRRFARWNVATSLLSSMPGALSFLLALAPSTNADMPKVATLQTTRVAILVAVLPLAAIALAPGSAPPETETFALRVDEALLLVPAGLGGAILAYLLRVPGGLLVGGLFVSAGLHGAGLVTGQITPAVTIAGFVVLGAIVGTRFTGISWKALGALLVVSLASFVLGTSLAAAFAGLAWLLTDLELMKLLLAFAPGGLEAMVALAFALDLDPAFVAAHHLGRFLLIALCAPFVVGWFGLRDEPES
ncbi:MAG: AbrB family transcriptional regulator [Devosiaceae bacterium]|nr:AbrB family transcriptional regulator [Devosiaceae bacterium MH13]